LNIVVIILVFKGLGFWKSWLFSDSFTTMLGFNVSTWRILLLLLLSLHAVLSFESVGAVMLIGLLVLPGATALLIAKSLKSTLILAVCAALIACVSGVLIGFQLNISIAPVIILSNSFLFLITFIYSKKHKRHLNFTKN
jgi:manganese/zinc/iron transport system permease protein